MAQKAPVVSKPAAKGEVSKTPVMKSVVAPVSTPVRNTPIPKVAAAKKEITAADVAKRAYEIYRSGTGGSETDNWHRAERELRSGM